MFGRKYKQQLVEAERVLDKIAHGNANDWRTVAAMRYFGWTWDENGKAIAPTKNVRGY